MPRIARMIVPDQKTVYHVMSRTALDGYPFNDIEKDKLVDIIKRLSKIYFTDILGYCIMGNHFHLLVRMHTETYLNDEEIKKRYILYYGNDNNFSSDHIPRYRSKWSSISEFMREIKQTFSRSYNKNRNRKGTFWADRYKSVIVENGNTLIHCLAYIDLNPVRAGLVEKPDNYRWNSIGYHVQTGNKDCFLSWDFGLNKFGIRDKKKRLIRYREYVYEAGAIDRSEEKNKKTIPANIINKERKKSFEISRMDRFINRSRYFTDSGIIGSKVFVSDLYQRFKENFKSVNEKIPKHIKGLDGIYSLKRLT
ncbi:MAG: transposase [Proteobacteria bacterium]|nr:transposase [Pseudomonadota bacterium]